MPRSGVNGTYTLPPDTDNQQPLTPISSSMFNSAMDDVEQTFNTPTPVVYGGTGAADAATARTNLGVIPADTIEYNYIINPLGAVNQRGYISGASTTSANQYTVDRFRVVTSGQSLSWSESAGVKTFTCPPGGVEQVIEGSTLISGTYVLSWTGTAAATVNGVSVTSGSTVSVTGGANVTIRWSSGTMSLPQFVLGSVAPPFSPRHIQQELALCQRYYKNLATIAGFYSSGDYWSIFPVPEATTAMRAIPTIATGSIISPDNGSVLSATPTVSFMTGGNAIISPSLNGSTYPAARWLGLQNVRLDAEL